MISLPRPLLLGALVPALVFGAASAAFGAPAFASGTSASGAGSARAVDPVDPVDPSAPAPGAPDPTGPVDPVDPSAPAPGAPDPTGPVDSDVIDHYAGVGSGDDGGLPWPPSNASNKLDPASDPDYVALSSKPDAPTTLWLSFNGGTLTNTVWSDDVEGGGPIVYDAAAVPLNSKQARTEIFERVAEIFSPFDIDVTTVYPGDDRLNRTSPDDTEYGVTALITGDTLASLGLQSVIVAQGLASLNSFGDVTSNYFFVSTEGLFSAAAIAPSIAHEAGHTLGLSHSGWQVDEYHEYYEPIDGLWAPAMGATFGNIPFTRWSDNAYPHATRVQDDMAIMTTPISEPRGLHFVFAQSGDPLPADRGYCNDGDVYWLASPDDANPCIAADEADPAKRLLALYSYNGHVDYRADEIGDTPVDALTLTLTLAPDAHDSATSTATEAAVITTNGDRDVFRLEVPAADVELHAQPTELVTNLDIKLTVTDASGSVVQIVDPPDTVLELGYESKVLGADARTELSLPAGTYYLTVEGTGFGDVADNTETTTPGAPAYGSVGRYTLDVTVTADPTPPTPDPTPGPTPPGPTPGPTPAPAPSPTPAALAATGSAEGWPYAAAAVLALALGIGLRVSRRPRRG